MGKRSIVRRFCQLIFHAIARNCTRSRIQGTSQIEASPLPALRRVSAQRILKSLARRETLGLLLSERCPINKKGNLGGLR
jgi:hypothetical protein